MFRFFKPVWESFKEYITLLIILAISLVLLAGNESAGIRHFRTFLFGTFATVSSVTTGLFSDTGMKGEVQYLRNRNAELMLEVNKLRKYSLTRQEMNYLEKFQDSSSYSLLHAHIAFKSILNSQNTFTINRGSNNGVKPGLPVLTDAGLVGIISTVSSDFAIVNTLKSSELKLIVQEERTMYQGIMRWNGVQLLVTNLPKTADVRVGDRFITSASSSLMNAPCSVGKVKRLINPEQGNMYIVELEPSANLERINYAFVYLNYSTEKPFMHK